jgi:hypothetical protein
MSFNNTCPRPRANTTPERGIGAKRSPEYVPTHKHAVGVAVKASAETSLFLKQVTVDTANEVIGRSGLELATFIASGFRRVNERHAVTVAPVTLIGAKMHLADIARRKKEENSPELRAKNASKPFGYKRFTSVLAGRINRIHLIDPLVISDVDWYGNNDNVLVAKLDTETEGYERLERLYNRVLGTLSKFDLDHLGMTPPDHVTLARFGTNRRPITFNDDIRSFTLELARPIMIGAQVQLGEISLTSSSGNPIPLKKREYAPKELTAYQAWKDRARGEMVLSQ